MYSFIKPDCEYRTTLTHYLPVADVHPLFLWADSCAVKPWTLIYAQQFSTPLDNRVHVKFIFEKELFK